MNRIQGDEGYDDTSDNDSENEKEEGCNII